MNRTVARAAVSCILNRQLAELFGFKTIVVEAFVLSVSVSIIVSRGCEKVYHYITAVPLTFLCHLDFVDLHVV